MFDRDCGVTASAAVINLMELAFKDPFYLRYRYKPDCALHGYDDTTLPSTRFRLTTTRGNYGSSNLGQVSSRSSAVTVPSWIFVIWVIFQNGRLIWRWNGAWSIEVFNYLWSTDPNPIKASVMSSKNWGVLGKICAASKVHRLHVLKFCICFIFCLYIMVVS